MADGMSPKRAEGSSADEVLYSVRGRVASIVLNRPRAYNAITATLPSALSRAVARANAGTKETSRSCKEVGYFVRN